MRAKLAFLLSLAFVCLSCIKEKPTGADLKVGDIIPDFEVMMNDGSVVTGQELRQSVSCVVFFHTSCPDCQQVLPHIQQLYDKFAPLGVRFALISREDEDAVVSAYWNQHTFTMPYSAQSTREVYELFAQTRVPRVYLCEKGGIISYIHTDDPVPGFDDLNSQLISVCDSGKE